MEKIEDVVRAARKIVIKIGSNTLADKNGRTNRSFMDSFAAQCARMTEQGKQICIVSSGAQVAGVSTIDRWSRKRDIHYRQALCAVGQVELMDQWREAFAVHGLHIGQLLLTKEDFLDEHRSLNIRNTLFTLVDEGVIPIINENDSVCCDEIRIGDNDNLSALAAILWSADLLILFSDIDGVYTKSPGEFPDAELIPFVTDIEALKKEITVGSVSEFGTGGIATKIEAAGRVMAYAIPMILANGERPECLSCLAGVNATGTLFFSE